MGTWKLKEINDPLKEEKSSVMVSNNPNRKIESGKWRTVHCGHLVLLTLYNKLGMAKFSAEVTARCFVALRLLKAFQRQANEGLPEEARYSTEQIINALAGMDYNVVRGTGYVPAYSAMALISRCCEVSGIHIDIQIVLNRRMLQYVKMLNKC